MQIDDTSIQRALDHFTKRMTTYEIEESDVVSVDIHDGKPREVEVKDATEGTVTTRSFEVSIFYWTAN
jgi:hypothetical protein